MKFSRKYHNFIGRFIWSFLWNRDLIGNFLWRFLWTFLWKLHFQAHNYRNLTMSDAKTITPSSFEFDSMSCRHIGGKLRTFWRESKSCSSYMRYWWMWHVVGAAERSRSWYSQTQCLWLSIHRHITSQEQTDKPFSIQTLSSAVITGKERIFQTFRTTGSILCHWSKGNN